MIAATDWTNVLLALIAATPGIIAAVYSGRVHRKIRTPSGEPIGKVVEYAHDTTIANNLLLSAGNGPTKPFAHADAHETAKGPPQVPDDAPPASDEH